MVFKLSLLNDSVLFEHFIVSSCYFWHLKKHLKIKWILNTPAVYSLGPKEFWSRLKPFCLVWFQSWFSRLIRLRLGALTLLLLLLLFFFLGLLLRLWPTWAVVLKWKKKIPLSLVENKWATLDKWPNISLCHCRAESSQIQGKQGQAQMSFRGPGLVWVDDGREEGRKEERREGQRRKGPFQLGLFALWLVTSKDQGTLIPLSTGSRPVNAMSPLYSLKGTRLLPEGCPV